MLLVFFVVESVGYIGNLERNIWIKEKKISEIIKILTDTENQTNIFVKEHNIVLINKLESDYVCNTIEGTYSLNLNSFRIKIPSNFAIKINKYYDFIIRNNVLIDIISSSEIAFKNSNNSNPAHNTV